MIVSIANSWRPTIKLAAFLFVLGGFAFAGTPPSVTTGVVGRAALHLPSLGPSDLFVDPTGVGVTLVPPGAILSTANPFFQSIGSNGRSCATCHAPQSAWSVTPSLIQSRFTDSAGKDPLFRLIDGATCPTADISTPAAMQSAYSLLLSRGVFRVAMPIPAGAQFTIPSVQDPYNCTSNPATGLTSPSRGVISIYRRPLPSTNLGFETTVMWDGREKTLAQQAIDATLNHAQSFSLPRPWQVDQMVAFERSLLTAQLSDNNAGLLVAANGLGGPALLAEKTLPPSAAPAPSQVFNLFSSWERLQGADPASQARLSIARGQAIFNFRPMTITGIAGFNNSVVNGQQVGPTFQGACSSCHDVANVGSNRNGLMLAIGITGPQQSGQTALPEFTLQCKVGPLAGNSYVVTDPGQAMITGLCADIGKTKVPSLRGLAGRAPYFSSGQAAALSNVVGFYNGRFKMGLSTQDQQDLVNFLSAL